MGSTTTDLEVTMTKLIRDVDVSISYGDVLASTTIPEGTEMPGGMRAQLHRVIDSLADQLNLTQPAPAAALTQQDRALLENLAERERPRTSVADSHALLGIRDSLAGPRGNPTERDIKLAQQIDVLIDEQTKAASDREYGVWPYRRTSTTTFTPYDRALLESVARHNDITKES